MIDNLILFYKKINMKKILFFLFFFLSYTAGTYALGSQYSTSYTTSTYSGSQIVFSPIGRQNWLWLQGPWGDYAYQNSNWALLSRQVVSKKSDGSSLRELWQRWVLSHFNKSLVPSVGDWSWFSHDSWGWYSSAWTQFDIQIWVNHTATWYVFYSRALHWDLGNGWNIPNTMLTNPWITNLHYLFSLPLDLPCWATPWDYCIFSNTNSYWLSNDSMTFGFYLWFSDITMYSQGGNIFRRAFYDGSEGIGLSWMNTLTQKITSWVSSNTFPTSQSMGALLLTNWENPWYTLAIENGNWFVYPSYFSYDNMMQIVNYGSNQDQTWATSFLTSSQFLSSLGSSTTIDDASYVSTGSSSSPTQWGTGTIYPWASSIDSYYSSCTGVDVPCYIKSTIWAFFGEINKIIAHAFDYFFPTISISGSTDFCSTSSWSFLSLSGTVWDGVGEWQVSNTISSLLWLVNPFFPSSGTEVCTVMGKKTIAYPETGRLDFIIIFILSLSIFFTTYKKWQE